MWKSSGLPTSAALRLCKMRYQSVVFFSKAIRAQVVTLLRFNVPAYVKSGNMPVTNKLC